jgi:hypothetical protein
MAGLFGSIRQAASKFNTVNPDSGLSWADRLSGIGSVLQGDSNAPAELRQLAAQRGAAQRQAAARKALEAAYSASSGSPAAPGSLTVPPMLQAGGPPAPHPRDPSAALFEAIGAGLDVDPYLKVRKYQDDASAPFIAKPNEVAYRSVQDFQGGAKPLLTNRAPGEGNHVVAAGSQLRGPDGSLIAQAPFAPQIVTASPESNVLVVDKNGDAAPGIGAPAAPRADRNNNPGNLKASGDQWWGMTGVDPDGFVQFDSPENGQRAAGINLANQAKLHGINTLGGLIGKYAPASDGNDETSYVAAVSRATGIAPDQPVDFTDPAIQAKVMPAMFAVERGGTPSPATSEPAGASSQSRSLAPPMLGGGSGVRVLQRGVPKAEDPMDSLTPEAIDYVAQQYISTGQLPPLGMGKAAAATRTKIINRAQAIEAETGATGQEAVVRHATVKAATSSLAALTKTTSMVESFENTAKKNADLMLELAPKGGGQTKMPVVNRWLQAGRKHIAGDADVANFDIALGTFADEYAKIVSGATGAQGSTDASRREAYERLSKYATQGQLQGGIATMKREMANRIDSLHEEKAALEATIRGVKQGTSKGPEAALPPPTKPPVEGAKRGKDGWYVEDPNRPGSFPRIDQGPDGKWRIKSANGQLLEWQ